MSSTDTTSRSALWAALCTVFGGDAAAWLSSRRAEGASWRELEYEAAEAGVPVSHEYLRQQAKDRGLDRKAA